MHKTQTRKLSLKTETVRSLTPGQLEHVVGGTFQPVDLQQGFIMKDSVIVRTSR